MISTSFEVPYQVVSLMHVNTWDLPLSMDTKQRSHCIFTVNKTHSIIQRDGEHDATSPPLYLIQSDLWMAPVPSRRPVVFKIQQGSCSPWDLEASGDHWSNSEYYSDFHLLEGPHRHGINIVTLLRAGPCNHVNFFCMSRLGTVLSAHNMKYGAECISSRSTGNFLYLQGL